MNDNTEILQRLAALETEHGTLNKGQDKLEKKLDLLLPELRNTISQSLKEHSHQMENLVNNSLHIIQGRYEQLSGDFSELKNENKMLLNEVNRLKDRNHKLELDMKDRIEEHDFIEYKQAIREEIKEVKKEADGQVQAVVSFQDQQKGGWKSFVNIGIVVTVFYTIIQVVNSLFTK